MTGSNNTNKLSPQEHEVDYLFNDIGSNNTNKLSPQEPKWSYTQSSACSNNTNKLSPQEHLSVGMHQCTVQIIQINLVLKNTTPPHYVRLAVQIIQINLVLKNISIEYHNPVLFK